MSKVVLLAAGSTVVVALGAGGYFVLRAAPEKPTRDTLRELHLIIEQALPAWSAKHGDLLCPPSIRDLAPLMLTEADAWGTQFLLACVPVSPELAMIRAVSAGPDRAYGTSDDIVIQTERRLPRRR